MSRASPDPRARQGLWDKPDRRAPPVPKESRVRKAPLVRSAGPRVLQEPLVLKDPPARQELKVPKGLLV